MDIKNHNTNRKKRVVRKRWNAAVLIALFVGILLTVFQYLGFVSKTVYEESVSHLTEIFHQSDNMLSELTNKNLTYLHIWGEYLQNTSDESEIREYIEKAQEDAGFLDFYFLSADGNYKMATGETGYLGLQENIEDEIRQGYISVQGGHRVGVTGKVLLNGDRIRGMKYISCINVRLSHQIPGCADAVMPYIQSRNHISHTLIISPPRCGKTTLLRDVIRQLSNGREGIPGVTVGVVDERSELAGSWQGVPQNDLGMRTDILDACPKAEGMQMLVRSMSPDVVAVDELGREEDFRAVESVIHCGCRLIATAHGNSVEDILNQPFFQKLKKMEIFEKYIVLGDRKQIGIIKGIYDEKGQKC